MLIGWRLYIYFYESFNEMKIQPHTCRNEAYEGIKHRKLHNYEILIRNPSILLLSCSTNNIIIYYYNSSCLQNSAVLVTEIIHNTHYKQYQASI